jgi:hypothetical protein
VAGDTNFHRESVALFLHIAHFCIASLGDPKRWFLSKKPGRMLLQLDILKIFI